MAVRAGSLGKVVHVFSGKLGEGLPRNTWQLHAITPPGCQIDDANREASEFLVRSIQSAFQAQRV